MTHEDHIVEYRIQVSCKWGPHEPERRLICRDWHWAIIGPKGTIAEGATGSEYLAYLAIGLAMASMAGEPL